MIQDRNCYIISMNRCKMSYMYIEFRQYLKLYFYLTINNVAIKTV